jgi:hypothetical protein
MIKHIKEIVILALTSGILILLGVIIIGDYWVAVKENQASRYRDYHVNENVNYRFDRYNRRLYWW